MGISVRRLFESYLQTFQTDDDFSAVFGFLMEGEVGNPPNDSLHFAALGLAHEMVKNRLLDLNPTIRDDLGSMSYNVCYRNDSTTSKRYLHDTGYPMLITDYYPFHPLDSICNTWQIQEQLQKLILAYRHVSVAARSETKPWMSFAQVYAYRDSSKNVDTTKRDKQGNWLREPTVREIAVQAHLMAAMGAKGVGYYLFCSAHDSIPHLHPTIFWSFGLVDTLGNLQNDDLYNEHKADSVIRLNRKLEKYGEILKDLTWQNSIDNGDDPSNLQLKDTIRVTDIKTVFGSPDTEDVGDSTFYHIGWLRNNTSKDDYLYIVNKRTWLTDNRGIKLSFNASGSILIESADSSRAWVITDDTTFAEHLPPGDGKLFRIGKALWRNATPLDTVTTVTGCSTLRIRRGTDVYLGPGFLLDIGSCDTVICDAGAGIKLGGGMIRNHGVLILNGRRSLHGSGTIEGNGTIICADSLELLWNDSLRFTNGMTFRFDSCGNHRPRYWVTEGRIDFEGCATPNTLCHYSFEGCIDTLFIKAGSMRVASGVALDNIPNLMGWQTSVITSDGIGPNPAYWFVRDSCAVDIYGTLRATNTWFDACGAGTGWEGLLFGYENAYCDIDSCDIRGILMHPVTGGNAIAFYAATDTGNHVCNTNIYRDNATKDGDAVFLQPGVVSDVVRPSKLWILCDSIADDWYTGVSSVGSEPNVISTKILNNTNGVCADLGTEASIEDNCIEGSGNIGVRVNGSTVRLGWLRKFSGNNRIVNSDSTQCKVMNAGFLYGGYYDDGLDQFYGGENIISSEPPLDKLRVVAQDISFAFVQNECWGGVPTESDTNGVHMTRKYIVFKDVGQFLFCSDPGATLLYNPVYDIPYPISTLCSSVCENVVQAFHKSPSLPPQTTQLSQLRLYAAQGNFLKCIVFFFRTPNSPDDCCKRDSWRRRWNASMPGRTATA